MNPGGLVSVFARLASATVSGLVSIGAQTFGGVKTFAAAIVASAGIATSQITSPTSPMVLGRTNSVSGPVLRVGTDTGGTLHELATLSKTEFYGDSTLLLRSRSVNSFALQLLIEQAGVGGLQIVSAGTSGITVGRNSGSFGIYAENYGLLFSQNSNAFDGARFIEFLVGGNGTGTGVSPTIPIFKHSAPAPQAGQFVHVFGVAGMAVNAIDGDGCDYRLFGSSTPCGTEEIAIGTNSLTVSNSLATGDIHLSVSFRGPVGAWHYSIGSGAFTITLAANAPADTVFSYQITKALS